MIPMTSVLREEIKMHIKNKVDISDLIKEVNLKNEDLSFAIIEKIRIIDQNISNCNFTGVRFGKEVVSSVDVVFLRSNLQYCNFTGAIFLSKAWIRSCDVKYANFRNADVSSVGYEFSNFTGCSFCGAKIRIGTRDSAGSTFDVNLLGDLTKSWANKLKIEEM